MSLVKKDQLLLLNKYPLLIPKNELFTEYDGYITVKGKVFRLSLEAPSYPELKGLGLRCEWELHELLAECCKTIKKWTNQNIPLPQFLDQLIQLIEMQMEKEPGSLCGGVQAFDEQSLNLNHYSTVLNELQELGSDKIGVLSSDLKTLSLMYYKNGSDEAYELTLQLTSQYPEPEIGHSAFEIINTDLPDQIIKIIQKEKLVSKAFHTFCQQIEALSVIWESLALIDKQNWVIDPTHPKKADMYRRIFIVQGLYTYMFTDWPKVMARIAWDPLQPAHPPDIKFQGSEVEVENFRTKYEENLGEWSPDCNIVENLCVLLGLDELPSPPHTDDIIPQNVETGECSICLSVELAGDLPNESCGKCLSCYHAACLYEWLETIQGTRQIHGHVTGSCPNCESVIKCPCPQAVL